MGTMRGAGWRRGRWRTLALVLACGVAAPAAGQEEPVDHGPFRGYLFVGAQMDLDPFRTDRAVGLEGMLRLTERGFVTARIQGEDRRGRGADFLMLLDAGRAVAGRMWGGAQARAVAGTALRNGDWFWTAGVQGGGKDSFNPFAIELELRLAGGQGALEVWSSLRVGFTFPPMSLDGGGG